MEIRKQIYSGKGVVMEQNKIYNEDCLDTMSKMPDDYVDLTITSPPYNIGKMHSNHLQFGTYDGNNMKEDDYQLWQIDILNKLYDKTKSTGSLFYNHKVRIKNGIATHPLEFILKNKWILKQEIVWDMAKSANCDKIRYFPFSERVYWLVKDSKTKLKNDLSLSDVWRCVPTNKRKNNKHIAVMPEVIVDNILKTNIGYIVYDPFMGSGTTAKMALKNNRKYIGI